MSQFILRAHNQHDQGVENGNYDVACLTECSNTVSGNVERYRSRFVKGVAIDWNPDVIEVWAKGFRIAHPGILKRTPRRGTVFIRGRHLASKRKVAVLCSHRINQRYEGRFPRIAIKFWNLHAALDKRLIKRLIKHDYLVFLGSDINDRHAGLSPLMRALETLGFNDAVGYMTNANIVSCERGPRNGSDHFTFTAKFNLQHSYVKTHV